MTEVHSLPPGWWPVTVAGETLGTDLGDALLTWIHDTVAAPAPQLGRPGALCPYLPATLRAAMLFATIVPRGADPVAELRRHARSFGGQALAGLRRVSTVNPALLVVLPGRPDATLAKVVQAVKLDLIDVGMTCGEFYPDNDDRSVRNAALRIARSPVPLVAVRDLTPHDELFLAGRKQYSAAFHRWKEGSQS